MKKHRITLLIALCFVMLFGQESMAQTAIERLKTEYPAVMEQYGKRLQDLKTHYIFVIDVSGTMDEYKDNVVVPGIKHFLETLPEGDQASIIAFGGKARVICTPVKINAENRKLLIGKLDEAYDNADRLDKNNTYLNTASKIVLDEVEKDTVNDICIAVFFSDLCDESREKTWNRGEIEYSWDALKERTSKLNDRDLGVVATALSADDDKEQQRGIKLMENLFKGFTYSSNVKDVFGEQLEAFKHDLYVSALKMIVPEELNKAFEGLQLTTELSVSKKVRLLANINKNTPAFIKGISIDTAYLTDQSPNISEVKFFPNARIPRFKKSCKFGKVVFAQKWQLIHRDPYLSAFLKYHLDTPEPKTDKDPSFVRDLENLGITDALYSESMMEAKAPVVIGWPFWLFCVVAAAIIIYAILLVVNTIVPHTAKKKKLVVKDPLTNNIQYYQLTGKRTFTIGNQTCNCIIPGALFVINATCRNGSPLNILWKRRVVLALDPQNKTGVQMAQGSRNSLMKASIRKGKEVTVTQNIVTRFVITLS